jgi:hypothetical protein
MAKINYTEAEMIITFGLNRIDDDTKSTISWWNDLSEPNFTPTESELFEKRLALASKNIVGWNEEKLKMSFITYILLLSEIEDTDRYVTLFEKPLKDTIEGHVLSVNVDFMVAAGQLGIYKEPYFHFQEYKPQKNPSGDSMAQLLQAMMIGQAKNNNNKPMYGCEIIGKNWTFVLLKDKTYHLSRIYNSINRADLLNIIAILRKFKHILETELLGNS